ncbi:hypothetical protein ACH5RR_003360 [Cinchona calisaya]|uniref:DUF4283 domain-containing protein n=1 Tax=Cinchona calisaya TaxID=153742 RepID=A0ABD3AUK6_9GENT
MAEDIQHLSIPFKLALIGKFSKGILTMVVLRKKFQKIGFKGGFDLGFLDYRHILIPFDVEEDFLHCWCKGFYTILGYGIRVVKWILDFRPNVETPIVPVWISLIDLLVVYFDKIAHFLLRNLSGII